jgi:hypothetical protein
MRTASRIPRAWLVALTLALTITLPGAAAGADGPPIGSLFRCDRPVSPPRCTSVADTPRHHVALDPSLTDGLAEALRATMATDYGRTDLVMIEQDHVNGLTDVIAYAGDFGENGAAGWVYCPTDAPQGINPWGDRWCRHQELTFNLNPRYAVFFADAGSRDYVACHEMGHTVGLRHWGNPPESEGPIAATCMNADTPDGPTDLSADDVARIDAYTYVRQPSTRHRFLAGEDQRRPSGAFAAGGGLQALEVERASTIAGLSASADAVVVAHVVAVSPGRTFDRLAYGAVTLRVEELVAGVAGGEITLEVPLFDGAAGLARLANAGPLRGIYFLRSKATSAVRAGATAAVVGREAAFHRLMTFGSVVLDEGGQAAVDAGLRGIDRLDGRPFSAALAAVRTAAARERACAPVVS